VEIQDLAPAPVPFFLFQDVSFDALLHLRETTNLPLFRKLSEDALRRRRERQVGMYERAAGVLVTSRWMARSLTEVSGLPAEKVHVVYPGISAHDPGETLPVRTGPRRRLLFVGREFTRKGGDLVVAALSILRRDVDPLITLTVAGPPAWPLPGEVPPGVDFLGDRPLGEVARLYDSHDLFVVPSRLEPFGIVFAEATARGLPCVARNAYAMPEIIQTGRTGALVDGDDPAALADVIARTLADDGLYEACRAGAAGVAERFSWDRAGRDAVAAVKTTLSR
jgi:glycosyltransferase involved in cell wall biosynthesis